MKPLDFKQIGPSPKNNILKTHKTLAHLSLLFISIFVSFVLVEIVLRSFTVFPIHGHKNIQSHELLGFTLSTKLEDVDRFGFRNPSGIPQKLLAIGDSHTYGYNVDYETSWPAILSTKINREVYNFGVPGYSVLQYGVLLANIPEEVEEIILGLYLPNDFMSVAPTYNCITLLGKRSIEKTFDLEVPECKEIRKNKGGYRGWLKGHFAIASAIDFFLDRYWSRDTSIKNTSPKNPDSGKTGTGEIARKNRPTGEQETRSPRPHSITDRSNPKVGQMVDFFVGLLDAFRHRHPEITLKVLVLPSKDLVFYAAEPKCPGVPLIGEVHSEIDLRNFLMMKFNKLGILFEDALENLVKAYCRVSHDEGIGLYPPSDSHPYPQGYEAYGQAAYALYRKS